MKLKLSEIIEMAKNRCIQKFDVYASGVKIKVQSTHPEFSLAIQEYFFTQCDSRTSEFPFIGVNLIYSHDNDLFFLLLSMASRFRVLERVEFHPDNFYEIIYRDETGEILESRGGIRHLIFRSISRRQYCIITPDYHKDVLEFQKPGIRLIREIAFRAHQTIGYFPLHASAASNGSKAYLFVGDSGAGKTTLATGISVIAKSGIFLSSDITLIKSDGVNVNAVGWPGGGISAGMGTIDFLYSNSSLKSKSISNFKHEEGYVKKGKTLITPKEFLNFFPANMSAHLNIDAIFFPKISLDNKSFHIEQLNFDDAYRLASKQLRNSLSDTHRYGVFDVIESDLKMLNSFAFQDLSNVLHNIPAYSVYGHPISIAQHLAEVF